MSVLVVGLNFKGAPLDLLERFAFDAATLPKALLSARSSEHVREAVILSTCNRTEVYAVVSGFHSGLAALRQFLAEFHHVPVEEFTDRLYALYEDEAVSHLFAVASGIDSMVVGEPQILRQVRTAFRAADEEGAVASTLSALFRHAIRVGRRARAETDIARSAATFADAGARLARASLGSLRDRTVLVVGAGKMSDIATARIAQEGATVLVANRTLDRALAMAEKVGGEAVPIEALREAIARADLVLSSTGSPQPLITTDVVSSAMETRPERPLILLDLAVPRDIEPGVAGIENVTLKDLDDLREVLAPDRSQMLEVERVRAIIEQEVPRFAAWKRAHVLAPLLAALQERSEGVRAAELRRAAGLLAELTDREREAVETVTRSIVAKLLHDPVTTLKKHAGTPDGEALARALRVLWSLPDEGES